MNPVGINQEHQERAADGDGCEHGYSNAKAQCQCKALDCCTPQEEEDGRRNDDRHVRIENRYESSLEACLYSKAENLAFLYFFLESFKYEDVRIHRHTYGQYDARYTWKRQCRMEQVQNA